MSQPSSQRAAGHTCTRQKKTRKQNTRCTPFLALVVMLVVVVVVVIEASHHRECCILSIVSCGNKQTDLLPLRDKTEDPTSFPLDMFIVKSRHVRQRRRAAKQKIDGDFN